MNATFVGTTCIGRGGQRALVDTIGNNIYVNQTQYPVDPIEWIRTRSS
jgi:hypothetical protein